MGDESEVPDESIPPVIQTVINEAQAIEDAFVNYDHGFMALARYMAEKYTLMLARWKPGDSITPQFGFITRYDLENEFDRVEAMAIRRYKVLQLVGFRCTRYRDVRFDITADQSIPLPFCIQCPDKAMCVFRNGTDREDLTKLYVAMHNQVLFNDPSSVTNF